MAGRTLDDNEMIAILEEIAREGKNGAARIAAIRTLKMFDAEGQDAGDFDQLDAGLKDEVAAKRKARAA